jgi:hypothetical protein
LLAGAAGTGLDDDTSEIGEVFLLTLLKRFNSRAAFLEGSICPFCGFGAGIRRLDDIFGRVLLGGRGGRVELELQRVDDGAPAHSCMKNLDPHVIRLLNIGAHIAIGGARLVRTRISVRINRNRSLMRGPSGESGT